MGYSLLDRFQGCLIGSKCVNFTHHPAWMSLARTQMASLIQSAEIDLNSYSQMEQGNNHHIALATLPVILFFHDHPQLLRANLAKIAEVTRTSASQLEIIWLWSKAIALNLIGLVPPAQLIPLLLKEPVTTPLQEQLTRVQKFLEQGTPLGIVKPQLYRYKQPEVTALALAYYFFLTTPRDFHLAVRRASFSSTQPLEIMALTAALAGSYNGYSGLTITKRLEIQQNPELSLSLSQVKTLFQAWGGVAQTFNNCHDSLVISSCQVLQRRPQLKLISQQESWLSTL